MKQQGILTSLAITGKQFFYKKSIFSILDTQNYERKVGKYQNEPMMAKIKYAVKSQLLVQGKELCVITGLQYVVAKIVRETPATVKFTDCSFMLMVVVCPLIEEVIFRGILQNVVRKIQQYVPKPLAKAAIRIAITGALFAGAHLMNGGDYLSKTEAITQCAIIMLYPNFSRLYEKTGSLLPVIVAHMANNFVCYSICKLCGV